MVLGGGSVEPPPSPPKAAAPVEEIAPNRFFVTMPPTLRPMAAHTSLRRLSLRLSALALPLPPQLTSAALELLALGATQTSFFLIEPQEKLPVSLSLTPPLVHSGAAAAAAALLPRCSCSPDFTDKTELHVQEINQTAGFPAEDRSTPGRRSPPPLLSPADAFQPNRTQRTARPLLLLLLPPCQPHANPRTNRASVCLFGFHQRDNLYNRSPKTSPKVKSYHAGGRGGIVESIYSESLLAGVPQSKSFLSRVRTTACAAAKPNPTSTGSLSLSLSRTAVLQDTLSSSLRDCSVQDQRR